MGCFDTVYFACPNCQNSHLFVQTKAGKCSLNEYSTENALPLAIADWLNSYEHTCPTCGSIITFDSDTYIKVRVSASRNW